MNTFITIEPIQEYECVKFYSAKADNESSENDSLYNEFEKFLIKFRKDEDEGLKEEFEIILRIIQKIGESYARLEFFRQENSAFALPSNYGAKIETIEIKAHSKLRLYCVIVSDEIVVLCNGGWKTTKQTQDCPNVSAHFRFAEKLADYFNKNRRSFLINGKEMLVGEEHGFYI